MRLTINDPKAVGKLMEAGFDLSRKIDHERDGNSMIYSQDIAKKKESPEDPKPKKAPKKKAVKKTTRKKRAKKGGK